MGRMRELYERFLACGLMPGQFFKLSVNEAVDIVSCREKRRADGMEEVLRAAIPVLDIFGANLIEKALMALGMKKDGTFSLLEYFPEAYPPQGQGNAPGTAACQKKDKDGSRKAELSADMKIYKAKRIHHAYRTNQARAREKGGKHG